MDKSVDYRAAYISFNTVLIVISRVCVAKSHSADVERLIRTSQILKSSDRQSLLVETENEYLFIQFYMPLLTLWDPRPSTLFRVNSSNCRFKETPKTREQSLFIDIFDNSMISQSI